MLNSTEIRSLLPLAAEEAIAFAGKHLTRESIMEGARREDRWSIPLVAIREALMNAIVHADYAQHGAPIRLALFDDLIEIEKPGLLPFGLTIEDIMQGVSKLRNRVVARVFHELHLIEQWGSGIQRMTEACREPAWTLRGWKKSACIFALPFSARGSGSPIWIGTGPHDPKRKYILA